MKKKITTELILYLVAILLKNSNATKLTNVKQTKKRISL